MRITGRISGWNDEKGYGFVVPHDGGDRAFVHIKTFQFGSRRPSEGDLVSYSLFRDSRGRMNAKDVRFAGQIMKERKATTQLPRLAIGVTSLIALTIGTLIGYMPILVFSGYMVLSILSYIMYALDKVSAGKNGQRTPENSLHLVDLLGGWPGALIAQQQFRHKTVKTSFQIVFWFTTLANIAGVAWLMRSGTADSVTASLFGG